MSRNYIVPGGRYMRLSEAIFKAEHTLIAGTTGSGKSVLLSTTIRDFLRLYSPGEAELVLLDPKQMELDEYRDLPHVIGYADTELDCKRILAALVELMAERNRWCKANRTKTYPGAAVYVMIDELYPLTMGQHAREIKRLLSLLLTQSRAANIHLVACTQLPNRAAIPANIVALFTMRIGLRTMSSIESRQTIGIAGCEKLPLHGTALVANGPTLSAVNIPMIDYNELNELINYWTSKRCIA